MSHRLRTSFESVRERIAALAKQDDAFRADLRFLVESVLLAIASPNRTIEEAGIRKQFSSEENSSTERTELQLIERRSSIKAEACRWAGQRTRLRQEGADFRTEIAPLDREILFKATGVGDCALWMCRPNTPTPSDVSLYDVVAQCFEVLAEILAVAHSVVNELGDERHLLEETLYLVAEAQSALRAAIQQIDGPTDHDQISAYIWVREVASDHRVFIDRFMLAKDLADPANSADLRVRVQALDVRLQDNLRQRRRRRKLFGKLRYVLAQVSEGEGESQLAHWQTAATTLDELIASNVPPSNTEIRDLVLPHIEDAPELPSAPQGYNLVLREVRRFRESQTSSDGLQRPEIQSPDIEKAAHLLQGKSVVLIGGDSRPAQKEALEKGLNLSELVWVETKPGQSFTTFQRFVARPQVAVVLLAIRWASHAYKDVRQYCDRYQKPLVWLPGGINPAQVAARIISQAGDRLRHRSDQDAA